MSDQKTVAERRWVSAAELARIIRPVLKDAFPGVKFSVRSRSYSMGSSVDVAWTGGPAWRDVDAVLAPFKGISFDGMDDSTHYHPVTLPSGEVVKAGSYVFAQRTSSEEERVAAKRCPACGPKECGSCWQGLPCETAQAVERERVRRLTRCTYCDEPAAFTGGGMFSRFCADHAADTDGLERLTPIKGGE